MSTIHTNKQEKVMLSRKKSHYQYLELVLPRIYEKLNIYLGGDMSAHGDKGYSFREEWNKNGILFPRGMVVYLLSYRNPYYKTVRDTDSGWVDVCLWVIKTYKELESIILETEKELNIDVNEFITW